MKKRREQPADALELRRSAEQRLSEQQKSRKPEAGDQPTAEDTVRLVHELQVHQIELEMQNEELKASRAEVEAGRARYAELYEFAPAGHLTFDREGAIRLANLTVARLLGVERSLLVRRRFSQFVAESDRRAFSDFLERVFASQVAESCEVTLPRAGLQPLVVRIDGTCSANGQECRAVMLDITERTLAESEMRRSIDIAERSRLAVLSTLEDRKQSEAALQASDARFRELSREFQGLLDAIPDSIMLLDTELKVLWANRAAAAAAAIGTPAAALVGGFCYALWYGLTAPCEPCPVARSLADGRPQVEIVTRPDGRTWDIRTVPLLDAQGRTTRVIEIKRDITEHGKLEGQLRQAQKLEGIGQLAGRIAHDFNNVLGAVIGFAGVLQMKIGEGDPLRHFVDEIVAAGERGADITRQILMFSRKQSYELKPVGINRAVRGLEKMLRSLLPESIDLAFDLAGENPVILADASQFVQVLMNLVTNARDAIEGIGKIGIATGRQTVDRRFVEAHGFGEPGEYAVLTVSDTGHGMDAATRARIFEPFFTTKESGKGTGLGLAVVYGIVKQHRGHVNVYSEVGKGTVIRVCLPLAAADATAQAPPTAPVPVAGGSETILIAEDDAILRKLTRTVLGQHGYTVIEAVDGEDAVAKFAANKDAVRLVILDGLMPKQGGVDALEEIRRLGPGMKALFLSGYAEDLFSGRALRDESTVFIQKPVLPTDLLAKVRELLDG